MGIVVMRFGDGETAVGKHNAPIAAVYAYVSDFPRHTEWNHQPTEMTKLTEGR